MENPAKRREQVSATIAPTLWLTFGCSVFLALTLQAQPSWWSGTLNGNASIDYMVANQGQLKLFTARAVGEMNLTLTNSGGAGPALSNLVYGWQQDYLTNGYATNTANPYRPYKPSDYDAVNVGQLKYIGKLIWSRLIAAGYTEYPPSWVGTSNAADLQVANLGQLKSVFAFDPIVPPSAVTGLTATPIPMGIQLTWTDPTNNPMTTITVIQTNPEGTTTTYTLDGSSTSFSPPNLTPGVSYSFQVISSNNTSSPGTGSIATNTSQAAPPIPTTPEDLTGTLTTTNTSIDLSWPDSPGAIIYAIDRETIASGFWAYNYASSTALSFTDTNYTGGFRYQVRASADGVYYSSPSDSFPHPKYAVIDLGTNQYPLFLNNIGSIVLRSNSGYLLWKNGQTSLIPADYVVGLNDTDVMAGWVTNSVHIPVNTDQSNSVYYTTCAVEVTGQSTQFQTNFDSAFPARNISESYGPWTYDSSTPAGIDNYGNVFANATKVYGYWPYNDQGTMFWQTAEDDLAVQGRTAIGMAGPGRFPNSLAQSGLYQGTNFFIQAVGSSGVALGNYYTYASYFNAPSELISSGLAYWNGSINTLATNTALFSVNSAGEILGTTDGSVVVFNSSLSSSQYPPFAGAWNAHHEVVAALPITPIGYSYPYANGDYYCDGLTTNIYNQNDLIPDASGWISAGGGQINDEGAIVGTATADGSNPAFSAGSHGVMLIPGGISVDANRDGTIVMANDANNPANTGLPADSTSQSQPFRFWINSFDERNEQDNPGSSYQDSSSTSIVDQRDLENFARLWIYNKVPSTFLGQTKVQFGLKWKNVTGSPSIRLFRAYESDGGTKYLTDAPTATAIANDSSGEYSQCVSDQNGLTVVAPVSGAGADFIFADGIDDGYSPTNPEKHFIFEGVGVGKGELVPVYLDASGHEIGEGPGVWLDLENIKTMYKTSDADQVVQAGDETPQGIGFVHGWQMSSDGSRTFAEDMFKRLWHRGFKGRFCYFRWNTGNSNWFGNYVPIVGQDIDSYLANYNGSEHTAWHTGAALDTFIASAVPSGYSKNLVAHSMGNIVAGSGFLNGLTVSHYAMLQAAVPSCCYDSSTARQQTTTSVVSYDLAGVNLNVTLWANLTPDSDPDSATLALAYRGRLASYGASNFYSFYQPDDEATQYYWEGNNAYFKPDTGFFGLGYAYSYNRGGSSGHKIVLSVGGGASASYVTDPLEAMPYADQSWSKTAGADAGTGGAVTGGVNNETAYNFGSEHSAEFVFDIQEVESTFYHDLLSSLQIPQNP